MIPPSCTRPAAYLFWPALLVVLGPQRCLPWALGLAVALTAWAVVEFRVQLLPRVLPRVGYCVRTNVFLNKLLFAAAAAVAVGFRPTAVRRVVRPWAVWAAWNVVAAVACAAVSYPVVERPMIRLGRRLAPPVTDGRA